MLSEIYNKIGGAAGKLSGKISDIFSSKPLVYTRDERGEFQLEKGGPMKPQVQPRQSPPPQKAQPLVSSQAAINPAPKYNLPPVISQEHIPKFVSEAQLAGVSPEEFGIMARREQGPQTLPHQAAMVGGVDPNDKGLMQVNTINDKLVRSRFLGEIGRPYNPNNAEDSMIAARMVLQENRRILEQMQINGSYPWEITNEDLLFSYNLGPRGLSLAKAGVPEWVERLERYRNQD
jgi:hypothetical protein